MLAAHRDQENLVHAHQSGAATKQNHQAKAPGARYPKTPLKFNDENTNHGFAGKSVLQTKSYNENAATVGKGKLIAATPLEIRTVRAPLGNKTTNAKARAAQPTTGPKILGKRFETTCVKPPSTKRSIAVPVTSERAKLEMHNKNGPLDGHPDVEYCPASVPESPYESDVLPVGSLTLEGLKPENMFKGYYQYYYNPVDETGKSRQGKEAEEQAQVALKKGEEKILKDIEELEWNLGLSPVKKQESMTEDLAPAKFPRLATRAPSTSVSRQAASALALKSQTSTAARPRPDNPTVASKPSQSFLLPGSKQAPKLAITRNSSRERANAVAASRSTLGYSKGRSTLADLHRNVDSTSKLSWKKKPVMRQPRTLTRSAKATSPPSDSTITPARLARQQASMDENTKKLGFLTIFDVDEENDTPLAPLPPPVDLHDDFQMSTNF